MDTAHWSMPEIKIPQARRIVVDTTGAQIVQEESPAVSHGAVAAPGVVSTVVRWS
jgi:hypothetical protein